MSHDVVARWRTEMRLGHFEAGWRISDEILRRTSSESRRFLPMGYEAVWNGESLLGQRVLIRCGHGLGDTIQFLRYVPMVRRIARRVILQTQAPLVGICQTISGVDEIVTLYDAVAPESYDVAVEVMELPHLFRTTLSSIPAAVPYLMARPNRIRPNRHPAVGVVWQAGGWDPRRSIPASALAMFKQTARVTWHVLQRGRARLCRPFGFGVDSGSDDVAEAARTIASLDLLITVDSMPAHLAGALGVPTWLLLHAESDWRWLADRTDSPWYPTMRLFRQKRAGDWVPVIEEVKAELATLAQPNNQLGRPSVSSWPGLDVSVSRDLPAAAIR